MKPKLKQAKEWIEHAKSENSVHVSVPVDVMEQLFAEVSRARELPAMRTVEACMAENRFGMICLMEKGHKNAHRIVLTFEHIEMLAQRAIREAREK